MDASHGLGRTMLRVRPPMARNMVTLMECIKKSSSRKRHHLRSAALVLQPCRRLHAEMLLHPPSSKPSAWQLAAGSWLIGQWTQHLAGIPAGAAHSRHGVPGAAQRAACCATGLLPARAAPAGCGSQAHDEVHLQDGRMVRQPDGSGDQGSALGRCLRTGSSQCMLCPSKSLSAWRFHVQTEGPQQLHCQSWRPSCVVRPAAAAAAAAAAAGGGDGGGTSRSRPACGGPSAMHHAGAWQARSSRNAEPAGTLWP